MNRIDIISRICNDFCSFIQNDRALIEKTIHKSVKTACSLYNTAFGLNEKNEDAAVEISEYSLIINTLAAIQESIINSKISDKTRLFLILDCYYAHFVKNKNNNLTNYLEAINTLFETTVPHTKANFFSEVEDEKYAGYLYKYSFYLDFEDSAFDNDYSGERLYFKDAEKQMLYYLQLHCLGFLNLSEIKKELKSTIEVDEFLKSCWSLVIDQEAKINPLLKGKNILLNQQFCGSIKDLILKKDVADEVHYRKKELNELYLIYGNPKEHSNAVSNILGKVRLNLKFKPVKQEVKDDISSDVSFKITSSFLSLDYAYSAKFNTFIGNYVYKALNNENRKKKLFTEEITETTFGENPFQEQPDNDPYLLEKILLLNRNSLMNSKVPDKQFQMFIFVNKLSRVESKSIAVGYLIKYGQFPRLEGENNIFRDAAIELVPRLKNLNDEGKGIKDIIREIELQSLLFNRFLNTIDNKGKKSAGPAPNLIDAKFNECKKRLIKRDEYFLSHQKFITKEIESLKKLFQYEKVFLTRMIIKQAPNVDFTAIEPIEAWNSKLSLNDRAIVYNWLRNIADEKMEGNLFNIIHQEIMESFYEALLIF